MTHVLITRPHERAKKFSDRLNALGIKTLCAPVLEYVPLETIQLDVSNYDAIIFTSQYAVKAFEHTPPPQVPVFAVGSATAYKAIAAGFHIVHNADGNVDELARMLTYKHLKTDKKTTHILHVCGVHSHDVPVTGNDIKITKRCVYHMKNVTTLSDDIIAHIRGATINIAPFFSTRTAKNFMTLIDKHNLNTCLATINALCISDSVLKCLNHGAWKTCAATPHPSSDAMIEELLKYRIDYHE